MLREDLSKRSPQKNFTSGRSRASKQGIELLTRNACWKPQWYGTFPAGTAFALLDARLTEMAKTSRISTNQFVARRLWFALHVAAVAITALPPPQYAGRWSTNKHLPFTSTRNA